MENKILIIGENYSDIEEMYTQFGRVYEVMISSPIVTDICTHVHYFRPDMIMLALEGAHDYVVDEYKTAREAFENVKGTPFAVAGTTDDLMWFNQNWANLADITIDLSKSMVDIQLQIEVEVDKFYKKNGRPRGAGDSEATGTKGKTILVIDDSPIMLKIIREQLREYYDVVIVSSGQLALDYLADKMVDMILLDYDMPEMSGVDVMKRLKANAKTKSIPVVFLTGVSEKAKIAQALMLGPQGYLLKPIDRDKLFAMIHKCIG